MSHATDYIVVDTEKEIMLEAEEFAFYNVDRQENPDGSYHGGMTIHRNHICESYDDAIEFIRKHDRGFYDDHAVRFKDKGTLPPTKQMVTLKARMEKNREDKAAYAEKHSVNNHKAEFLGCKNCGSKIAKKYIYGNRCPVCGKSLLAEYIEERLEKYDSDFEAMKEQYKELAKKRDGKKCPVRWLMKVEVHC